jgi:hypothetical protein
MPSAEYGCGRIWLSNMALEYGSPETSRQGLARDTLSIFCIYSIIFYLFHFTFLVFTGITTPGCYSVLYTRYA